MTFEEFKNICLSKKAGDFQLPEDNELILGIQESVEEIANMPNIIPLALVSKDNSLSVLRPLSKDEFIRKPKSIEKNENILDIDESLSYAVIYSFLENLTKDDKKFQLYKYKKEQIINNYMWNNFKVIQEIGAKK